MNRRTLGILASLVGSAIAAMWVMIQRRARNTAALAPARDHGTVIFDNTATADVDAIL